MKPHLQIALALIWREGLVLVTRRRADADHFANVWEFPGGKCFVDEAPARAVVREAREEVGLEIEIIAAREVIEWDYEERRVSLHPFDCRIISGEVQALEVAEWKWCAPDELRADDFPPANRGLIEELNRQARQEESL